MANHRSFTDQDLLTAAAELEKTGKPINGNALRRLVGCGRPSSLMSAYNELVNAGKAQLPEKTLKEPETIESHNLPPEVKDELENGIQALTAMITRCNDIAHHVVEQRLNKAVMDAKDARIQAESSMAEANDNESKAWDEVDAVQKQLDDAQEINDTQATRIIELEQQLKASEKAISSLQNTEKQLKAQLNDTQSSLELAEKRASASDAKLDEVREQLATTKSELKSERNNATRMSKEQSKLAQSLGDLEGQLKSNQALAEKLSTERDQALKTSTSYENERDALKSELTRSANTTKTN